MQSLFSTLLDTYRTKKTKAFELFQNSKKCGHLYIQQGIPLSCFFLEFQGVEALEIIYQEDRSGIPIEFTELDCLAIYSENIKEANFEKLIMSLLERYKLRKVYFGHSRGEKQAVSYWQ